MTRRLPTLDPSFDVPVNENSGFGAIECETGRLPLVALDVRSTVSETAALTTVTQTFRNSLPEPIEATYIFPLPDRAAVTSFRLRVGSRVIDGVLKERGQARADYDHAIQTGKRAAIAEEERSGVFTMRAGNIPAGEEVYVELSLVAELPVADGEATYRFPLVVAPRYTAGIPLDGTPVGTGTVTDTDQVPDASRISPPTLLPGFPNPVRLSMAVTFELNESSSDRMSSIQSSLHSVITGEDPFTVHLQPGERLDRDFILRFPLAEQDVAVCAKTTPSEDQRAGTFSVTIVPPSNVQATTPRNVVFLLDRSGSMSGWKMVAARRAVGRMIDTLLKEDRFTVLAFDNQLDSPHQGLAPGTNQNRWKTIEWLSNVAARGGTDLGGAITSGVKLLSVSEPSVETVLVVVTDGQVSGESAILRQFKKGSGNSHKVFTVGIDQAVNAGFLKKLAQAGGGVCELVESESRLDAAMNSIHRLIGHPVLTNVRVEAFGADIASDSLTLSLTPDVYVDRPVTIYGRHQSGTSGVHFRITATQADGQSWSSECTSSPGDPNLLIPMWGRGRVRELEDRYDMDGGGKKLMDEIVAASLESNVLSRFTAYVAVDDSEIVNESGQAQPITQPVELPGGWQQMRGSRAGRKAKRSRAKTMSKSHPTLDASADQSFTQAIFGSIFDLFSEADDTTATGEATEVMDTAIDFTEIPEEQDSSGPDATVVQLVDLLLREAVAINATAISIERGPNHVVVRYRIDGNWVDRDQPPLHLFDAIMDRIKTLAGLSGNAAPPTNEGHITASKFGGHSPLTVSITSGAHGDAIHMEYESSRLPKRKAFWK